MHACGELPQQTSFTQPMTPCSRHHALKLSTPPLYPQHAAAHLHCTHPRATVLLCRYSQALAELPASSDDPQLQRTLFANRSRVEHDAGRFQVSLAPPQACLPITNQQTRAWAGCWLTARCSPKLSVPKVFTHFLYPPPSIPGGMIPRRRV